MVTNYGMYGRHEYLDFCKNDECCATYMDFISEARALMRRVPLAFQLSRLQADFHSTAAEREAFKRIAVGKAAYPGGFGTSDTLLSVLNIKSNSAAAAAAAAAVTENDSDSEENKPMSYCPEGLVRRIMDRL